MNETHERKLAWLRREIQKGLDDLDAGRFRDGAEVMAEFRGRILRLKMQQNLRIKRVRQANDSGPSV